MNRRPPRAKNRPIIPASPGSFHPRTCAEGRQSGHLMAQLADQEVRTLIAQGEYAEDQRCQSCAFRRGTVPNGCLQTQMDVLKAVLEQKPFFCHAVEQRGSKVCDGWFAAVQAAKRNNRAPIPCPWEFSPPDAPTESEAAR